MARVVDWAGIPNAVLQLILQKLPIQDRCNAAEVCTAWLAAADTGKQSLTLPAPFDAARLAKLQHWLAKHGQGVSTLQLQTAEDAVLRQLPCAGLRHLVLVSSGLQVPLWLPSVAANLTRLGLLQPAQRAQLQQGPPGQPGQQLLQESCRNRIRSLASLQHLSLEAPAGWQVRLADTLEAVQSLQSLTCLELHGMVQDAQEHNQQQQYFSQLTNLQVLSLHLQHHLPGGLQNLQRLTRLAIVGPDYDYVPVQLCTLQPGSSAAWRMGGLASLRSLQLEWCECEPRTLSVITALQSLSLKSVRWTAAAGFCQWLAQLRRLTQLTAHSSTPQLTEQDAPVSSHGALYAAITASTGLQQQDLAGIPDFALQHMYPAGRQLLQLRSLQLQLDWRCLSASRAAGVCAVLHCCPNLQALEAAEALLSSPALAGLHQLTRLHCKQGDGYSEAGGVGCMTGLQQLELSLVNGRTWKKQDLMPLRKLRFLTSLSLSGGARIPELSEAASSVLPRLIRLHRLVLKSASLSERQLYSLTALTALSHLEVNSRHLGVLLIDRLLQHQATDQQLSHRFDFQEQGTPIIFHSRAATGAPPDIAQQLSVFFRCNSRETRQELARLRIVEQQAVQLRQCLSQPAAQLQMQLQQANDTIAELRRQPAQLERQQQQQENAQLRQQLDSERVERQQQQQEVTQLWQQLDSERAEKLELQARLVQFQQRQPAQLGRQQQQQELAQLWQQLDSERAEKQALQARLAQFQQRQPGQLEMQQQQQELAQLWQQLDSERAEKQALRTRLAQFQQWAQQGAQLAAGLQGVAFAGHTAGAAAMGVMPGHQHQQAAAAQGTQQKSHMPGQHTVGAVAGQGHGVLIQRQQQLQQQQQQQYQLQQQQLQQQQLQQQAVYVQGVQQARPVPHPWVQGIGQPQLPGMPPAVVQLQGQPEQQPVLQGMPLQQQAPP